MWRKTRRPYSGAYGADPNRNFNYHFAGEHLGRSVWSPILPSEIRLAKTVFHRANNQGQMIFFLKKLPLRRLVEKKKKNREYLVSEWVSKWVNESASEWVDEPYASEWVDWCVGGKRWGSEWASEQVNGFPAAAGQICGRNLLVFKTCLV